MEAKNKLCSLLSLRLVAENGTTMPGSRISLNSQIHQSQVNSSELPAIPSTLKAMVNLAKSLLKPWQESPSQMLPLVVVKAGEITD